jgi:hypothetical protein
MAIYRIPVNLNYTGAGGPGVNVWHFRTADPEDSVLHPEADEALEAIHQFYVALGIFMAVENATFPGEAVIIDPATNKGTFRNLANWSVTSSSTSMLPPANALVVSWRTAEASRSGMGRTFVGPIKSANSETNGTPSSGMLTAFRNAAVDLVNKSEAANLWAIGVYSRQERVLRDITGSNVRDQFAVLRSRRD